MPRSYFSNLAGSGNTPVLRPSRPISALWKAARLEGTTSHAAETPAIGAPSSRIAPHALAARPLRTLVRPGPLDESAAASSSPLLSAVRPIGQKARKHQQENMLPVKSTEAARDPLALDARSARPHPPDKAHSASPLAQEIDPASQIEVQVARNSISRQTRRSRIAAEDNGDSKRRDGQAAEQRRPAALLEPKAESHKPAAVAGLESLRQIEAAQPERLRPEAQEHQARTASIVAKTDHARPQETQNSVHIGKVEIQIVPPAPAPRRTQPPGPRARLARGYTLWPGYSQI